MPTKKPKPDLVKAADNFSRKYEDVFGDKDPQDIINELRGDGDVSGASMNSSGESAAREQWMLDAAAEVLRILVSPIKSGWTEIAHEAVTDVLSRHCPKEKQMLPKFGSTTQCPKCGSEQIFSKYVAPPQANQEVMQRMCGGCGYGWNEAPLDRVAAQGEQHDH